MTLNTHFTPQIQMDVRNPVWLFVGLDFGDESAVPSGAADGQADLFDERMLETDEPLRLLAVGLATKDRPPFAVENLQVKVGQGPQVPTVGEEPDFGDPEGLFRLDDEDFAVVSNLTSLSALQVIFNQISDLSPVASLTALESLEVRGNQISDLSPLIGLTLLSHIQIDINQISDLLPLVDNSGIGEGDTVLLGQNPLSADAISTQIPALEARGVLVSEDTR